MDSFKHFVVYDFEATCDSSKDFQPQEIIEFSCVVVDSQTLEIWNEGFQQYVKPTENPELTQFCKDLTGITQAQVDAALPLAKVLEEHHMWLVRNWILAPGREFLPVTWTDWDLEVQLHPECVRRKIPKPVYYNKWMNLKKVFVWRNGCTMNLRKAVGFMDIKWQGSQHCGLDDARNTAKLMVRLAYLGAQLGTTRKFCITSGSSTSEAYAPETNFDSFLSGWKGKVIKGTYAVVDCKETEPRISYACPDQSNFWNYGRPEGYDKICSTVGKIGTETISQKLPRQMGSTIYGPFPICSCGVAAKRGNYIVPGAHYSVPFWSCAVRDSVGHCRCPFFAWESTIFGPHK